MDLTLEAVESRPSPPATAFARVEAGALRYRYLVLTLVTVGIWLYGLNRAGWEGQDWHFFVDGARGLTGDAGLHVYAQMPWLQFGPIALAAAVAGIHAGPSDGWVVVSLIDMAAGLLAIRVIEDIGHRLVDTRRWNPSRVVLYGGPFLLAAWASPAVGEGHPDDVLALLGLVAAAWAVATDRWLAAALFIGLAAAAKPWAILALPLAAAHHGSRIRGTAVAVVTALVPWVPFFLADTATRRVASFHLQVESLSGLRLFGVPLGAAPSWPHLLQFGVALVLGCLAVARGRWPMVLLIAIAVRINFDPATIDYYSAGAVAGALVVDVCRSWIRPGVITALTWIALFYLPDEIRGSGVHGSAVDAVVVIVRLLVLLIPIAVLVRPRARDVLRPTLSPDVAAGMRS